MDEEYKKFLKYRNQALQYAVYGSEGMTEEEVLLQAQRFFNFIMGDEPKMKRKKAQVVKLVERKK